MIVGEIWYLEEGFLHGDSAWSRNTPVEICSLGLVSGKVTVEFPDGSRTHMPRTNLMEEPDRDYSINVSTRIVESYTAVDGTTFNFAEQERSIHTAFLVHFSNPSRETFAYGLRPEDLEGLLKAGLRFDERIKARRRRERLERANDIRNASTEKGAP